MIGTRLHEKEEMKDMCVCGYVCMYVCSYVIYVRIKEGKEEMRDMCVCSYMSSACYQ